MLFTITLFFMRKALLKHLAKLYQKRKNDGSMLAEMCDRLTRNILALYKTTAKRLTQPDMFYI